MHDPSLRRRGFLKAALAGTTALAAGRMLPALAHEHASSATITRAIPSTGEQLPVIGLGTNAYGVQTPEDLAPLREVLRDMSRLGGTVIDTAHAYGRSEEVIGDLLEELGNRDEYFLATKTPIRGDIPDVNVAIRTCLERLRVSQLDLLQVHNLHEIDRQVPYFLAAREAGLTRYIGASVSSPQQYADFIAAVRRHPFDFVQVNYSIDDRGAAERILPMAEDHGMAVLINMPFGGRRGAAGVFARVADRPLPEWAAEIDAESWAQVFLKYVVSHPAVTAAIPGTTRLRHLLDNQAAGRGRLPDESLRRDIERYWDALPS
ncbi:MAG: aldo/keto reductase [Gammaproteobacteria bacterium]|nr:aldo/keto reductase [Gammaproteobacteria bacterium]